MAMQVYPLALLIVSGGMAIAIIFLMASVAFLDSPKQLLFTITPSAFPEYFPMNHTVRQPLDSSLQVIENGIFATVKRLFNDSTTRPSMTTPQQNSMITTIQWPKPERPKEERQEAPAQLLGYADNVFEITDEGLIEINSHQHPQDSPLVDHLASSSDQLLGLTMARINLRARQRLAHAGSYLYATARILAEYQSGNRSAPLLACSFKIEGGLGNWMFMVASIFGLARTNHRVPVVLYDYSRAERHFANFSMQRMNRSTFIGSDSNQAWRDAVRHETGAGKFRADLTNLTTEKNVVINGFLQSWKYFDAYRDDIRSLFTFSEDVYNRTLNTIETLLQSHWNATREPLRPLVLVGIHVRRGDVATDEQINYGYIPATEEYLLGAAWRLQQDYDPVVFIVVSNDIVYCRQLFAGLDNFVFSENTTLEVDMATMGLMDHLILSVGTYSWWAGYLSDAKTILYFKDWPRNGSQIKELYTDEDFFYPAWTPFS